MLNESECLCKLGAALCCMCQRGEWRDEEVKIGWMLSGTTAGEGRGTCNREGEGRRRRRRRRVCGEKGGYYYYYYYYY